MWPLALQPPYRGSWSGRGSKATAMFRASTPRGQKKSVTKIRQTMQLYSTNNTDLRVPYKEAVFNSLQADKGLYMPETIPAMNTHFIQHIAQFTFQDIAFKVTSALIGDTLSTVDL